MKTLKQIFLILAMTVGASTAASAQDKDQKQRPPKDPPQIVPGKDKEKDKPRENRPKDEDKDKGERGKKKPQMFVYKTSGETKIIFG